MAVIAGTGKERNWVAAMRRVIDSCWFGTSNNAEQAPLALNNESILAVNAAGTGTVALIKAANDNTVHLPTATTADGALTVTGTFTTSAGFTPTGGVTQISATPDTRNYAGSYVPAATTSGTDTAGIGGKVWVCECFIPSNCSITGISYLIGSVGGTDKVVVLLFDSAGNVVANSALDSSVTVGTAATFQRVPFTAPYAAKGPGLYFVGVQTNGTTAKIRTQVFGDHGTMNVSQTFNTPVAIAPPTTFTTAVAPTAMTY